MDKDTETNTGWWVEKPLRADRPSSYAALSSTRSTSDDSSIWLKAGIIIGAVVLLVWGVKTLLGW